MLSKIGDYLTQFLVLFLPFVIWPYMYNPYEAPKVVVGESLIAILFVVYLLKVKRHDLPRLSGVRLPYLVLALLGLMSVFFFRTETTLFGNGIRYQGVYLLWHLLIFSLLAPHFSKTLKKPLLIAVWFLLIGTTYFGVMNVSGRSVGTLGEPNALGQIAVFLFPAIFALNHRLAKIAGLIGIIYMLLQTMSQSAVLAFALELTCFGAMAYTKFNRARIFAVCGLLLAVSLVGTYIMTPPPPPPDKTADSQAWVESRTDIWKTAALSGLSSPVWGHGFGNVEEALKAQAWISHTSPRFAYVDDAHNIFLNFWVQGGMLGLGSFLALLFFASKHYLANGNVAALTMLLGLVTALCFNPASTASLIALYWLLGKSVADTSTVRQFEKCCVSRTVKPTINELSAT